MVPHRPHSVLVSAPEEQPRPDTALGIHAQAGGAERSVLVVPIKPGTAFEQYGTTVERPFQLFDEASVYELYQQGGEVLWLGRRFIIKAPPEVYSGIGGADNMSVLLEEVRG